MEIIKKILKITDKIGLYIELIILGMIPSGNTIVLAVIFYCLFNLADLVEKLAENQLFIGHQLSILGNKGLLVPARAD